MNSFILLKEEKKRIQKLYEATTAASSGQFNQPMAFTEPIDLDIETIVSGGDNIETDSLELTLDIDELSDLLNVDEDEDKERMRTLHREASLKYNGKNSILSEQAPLYTCQECGAEFELPEDLADHYEEHLSGGPQIDIQIGDDTGTGGTSGGSGGTSGGGTQAPVSKTP